MANKDTVNCAIRELFQEHLLLMVSTFEKEKQGDWDADRHKQWAATIHSTIADAKKLFPMDILIPDDDPIEVPSELPVRIHQPLKDAKRFADLPDGVTLKIG